MQAFKATFALCTYFDQKCFEEPASKVNRKQNRAEELRLQYLSQKKSMLFVEMETLKNMKTKNIFKNFDHEKIFVFSKFLLQ